MSILKWRIRTLEELFDLFARSFDTRLCVTASYRRTLWHLGSETELENSSILQGGSTHVSC